jgi:hypothetical protein
MKKAIYLISFVLLVSCGHNEETVKETDLLIKEVKNVIESKEKKKNVAYWQTAYITLNISLERYKKADPEAIEVAKEAKDIFEETYNFGKKNELSGENLINLAAHVANSFTLTANLFNSKDTEKTTVSEFFKQHNEEQKHLIDKYTKLIVHLEQLDKNICNKYQLNCKANTPDKPDQKKEPKSN